MKVNCKCQRNGVPCKRKSKKNKIKKDKSNVNCTIGCLTKSINRMATSLEEINYSKCHHEELTNGIQAKLLNSTNSILIPNEIVAFDKVLNHIGTDIIYEPKVGLFTVKKPGTYLINWNITIEGTDQMPFVTFAVMVNGQIEDSETIPISVGHMVGSSLITLTEQINQLAIVNQTEDDVLLSRYTPIANITIHQVE